MNIKSFKTFVLGVLIGSLMLCEPRHQKTYHVDTEILPYLQVLEDEAGIFYDDIYATIECLPCQGRYVKAYGYRKHATSLDDGHFDYTFGLAVAENWWKEADSLTRLFYVGHEILHDQIHRITWDGQLSRSHQWRRQVVFNSTDIRRFKQDPEKGFEELRHFLTHFDTYQ